MCSCFDELEYKDGKLYRNGKEAGWVSKHGHRFLSICNKKHLTHRAAWPLHHGTWPKVIDHINQNSPNNRTENLRECTQPTNVPNKDEPQPHNKTSGVRSVHRHSVNNKWIAQITVQGKCRHLGSFDTIEDAKNAYLKAKQEVFDNV